MFRKVIYLNWDNLLYHLFSGLVSSVPGAGYPLEFVTREENVVPVVALQKN